MRWWLIRLVDCTLALCFVALSFVSNLRAQDEADEEPFAPGLIAEFRQPKVAPVQRLETVVAAEWPGRPDERLRAGDFFAVAYRGLLDIPEDGNYQLHVHARGSVRILLDGKKLIDTSKLQGWASSPPQSLKFGPLPIDITFLATEWPAEVSIFWSSERFEREPVPARALLHDRTKVVSGEFEHGRVLARALRCEACHAGEAAQTAAMPAPALDQLGGQLQREWLIDWLKAAKPPAAGEQVTIERRMPYLALPAEDAELLADWLLSSPGPKPAKVEAEKPNSKEAQKNAPSREAGEHLLHTRGCLACHRVDTFGESGLFGGGDLTAIAAKRPAGFFAQWLQDPAKLNRDHRMPVFDLKKVERDSLALALAARGERRGAGNEGKVDANKARALARKHRCDQCHRLPEADALSKVAPATAVRALSQTSDWQKSCASQTVPTNLLRPQFSLSKSTAAALATYFSQRVVIDNKTVQVPSGEQLLIENNCLACHTREPQPAGVLPKKFGDKLVQLAASKEEFAAQIPGLSPPSLNSVGDKLTDPALAAAITRAGPAHRPYLQVQMPRFRLSKEQTDDLAAHFIEIDRIPDYERSQTSEPTQQQLAARALAGKRLVGTDGFSCTACHKVGSVEPVKAPPNARGPTLSMPQNRLRKAWFDRWVRNPARIVPRMEMPSVQTPVRGVLQDNLHDQLAAVWQVLSTPGFEPPLPEPVRTLRFYSSEDNSQQQPLVVTDLIEYHGKTLERAALIGLPNRQNILFDFATHRLLAWSQGDLARQRTKGKNWYWEPAGSVLFHSNLKEPELELEVNGERFVLTTAGQWLAEPWTWKLAHGEATFKYLLRFRKANGDRKSPDIPIDVQQILEPFDGPAGRGVRRRLRLHNIPKNTNLLFRILDAKESPKIETIHGLGSVQWRVGDQAAISLELKDASFQYRPEGMIVLKPTRQVVPIGASIELAIRYNSQFPPDEYHVPRPPPLLLTQPAVTIAPGFAGERLSLPTDIMPTALAWWPNGDLAVASLKGQVIAFRRDSLSTGQPVGELIADGLAAPYGLQATPKFVDVATKHSLIRMYLDHDLGVTDGQTIASGWGYTADYHDWCVGLPKDAAGNYYLALPCFQDNREDVAKRWRGSILKLKPNNKLLMPSIQPFDIEVLTHGHRFPMGMALNKDGELLVTDNQGNYNPFNELNHVVPGKHFGFVNKGQEKPEQLTPPAIDIPHPWTRSVNGICFLNTPRESPAKNVFGALEGHLVGCEYDTRRLVRMSLQKVGGEYQGCAYPLTIPTPPEQAPLGPICCEISPAGELVIGSLRDSGWGAANNIGEVIRVTVDPTQFGHGLAEMRAVAEGFELTFFAPVEKGLAEDLENYVLASYRRESTPAYGGSDIDRRTEKISHLKLSPDRRKVTLILGQLRAGHVYELRLKSLAPAGELFFPAEAHYTLRRVP